MTDSLLFVILELKMADLNLHARYFYISSPPYVKEQPL